MKKTKVGSKTWLFTYPNNTIGELAYNNDIEFFKTKGTIEIVFINNELGFEYTPYKYMY